MVCVLVAVLQREKQQNSASPSVSQSVADLQHSDLKRVNSEYAPLSGMCSTTCEWRSLQSCVLVVEI